MTEESDKRFNFPNAPLPDDRAQPFALHTESPPLGPTVTERDLEAVIALIDAQDSIETVAVSSDLAVLLCDRLNADDFVTPE